MGEAGSMVGAICEKVGLSLEQKRVEDSSDDWERWVYMDGLKSEGEWLGMKQEVDSRRWCVSKRVIFFSVQTFRDCQILLFLCTI